MDIRHYSLFALAGVLLASCSSEKSSSDNDKLVTLNSESPSDTTNTSGSVTVAFGMAADDAAMALDDTPATNVIGDVTLSYAKFSIAKIKIKPNKEPSESEKKNAKRSKLRIRKQKLRPKLKKRKMPPA